MRQLWPKILFGVLLLAAVGWAQETIDLEPSLGEFVRHGHELPVTIKISNRSQSPQSYSLELTGSDARATSQTELTVEKGSTRRVDMVAPMDTYFHQLHLAWNGKRPAKSVEVRHTDSSDHLFLMLTPQGTEMSYVAGFEALKKLDDSRQRQVYLNRPTGRPLPQRWASYKMHDFVVVYDLPALAMELRVQEAIRDYVIAGGVLVLVSNGDAGEYRNTVFEPLLPLTPKTAITVGEVPMVTGPQTGATEFSREGKPLLVSRPLGRGFVLMVTVPAKSADLLGLEQSETLWTKITKFGSEDYHLDHTVLLNPPEVPKPSSAALAWYLLGYALLVGPVNLIWLRRKDQTLKAFFTIPIIAVIFAGGAFLFNWLQRSNELVAREEGILWAFSETDRAFSDSRLVLFSPASRRHRIRFPSGVGVASMMQNNHLDELTYELDQGMGLVLPDYSMPMWSARQMDLETVQQLDGPFRLDSQDAQIEISNPLPAPLYRAVVKKVRGNEWLYSEPFTVEPGQKIYPLRFGNSSPYAATNASDWSLALTVLDDSPLQLAGWYDGLPTELEMKDLAVHHSRHLVVVSGAP